MENLTNLQRSLLDYRRNLYRPPLSRRWSSEASRLHQGVS